MSTITIEEAQAKLTELVGQQLSVRKPCRPGSAKGKLVILAEDDEHLEDFKDYMS